MRVRGAGRGAIAPPFLWILLLVLAALGSGLGASDGPVATPKTYTDALKAWQAVAQKSATAVSRALVRAGAVDSAAVGDAGRVVWEDVRVAAATRLEVSLEVEGAVYRFASDGEPEWRPLEEALPAAQGGLLPRGGWEALEAHWLAPVTRGAPQLPPFALAGPLELLLSPPSGRLSLRLPHETDLGSGGGAVSRVLLADGAAVTVRGAAGARLRRPVDLPPVGLSDFARIVMADADGGAAAGLMHLVAGVRDEATRRWNASRGPASSPALVSIELDLAPGGALTLESTSADDAGAAPPRLKARRLKEGVIELLPRAAPEFSAAPGALAVRGGGAAAAGPQPYAWPLRSAASSLHQYESLLREILASRLFNRVGQQQAQQQRQQAIQPEPAPEVGLRLRSTSAQAATLLSLRLEVDRAPAARAGAADAADRPLRTPQELVLASINPAPGDKEVYRATVRVEGDLRALLGRSGTGAGAGSAPAPKLVVERVEREGGQPAETFVFPSASAVLGNLSAPAGVPVFAA